MPFLHHYGYGGFFAGFGSASGPTNCWTTLIQLPDGGYGHDDGQIEPNGELIPQHTSDGILIYSMRFYSTGEFYMEFGDAGEKHIENADNTIVEFFVASSESVLLAWNETNLRYEGFDVNTASAIKAHLGEEVCMRALAVPIVLIHYDYGTMYTEGVNDVQV